MASTKKLYKLRLRERPRLGRAKPCQSVRVLGGAEQKVQGGELANGPQKRWGRALAKAGEHSLLLKGPGTAGAQRIKNVPQLFLDDGRRAEQVKFFKRHVPGVARVHRLERRPVALGFEQLFECREALDGTAQHRHRLPRLHRPQYLVRLRPLIDSPAHPLDLVVVLLARPSQQVLCQPHRWARARVGGLRPRNGKLGQPLNLDSAK